jgi:SAM-dependent methyltransferase
MFSSAEGYNQFMGRWSRLVAPLLLDFAAVPDTGRVLDVGSATGTLAFEIAKGKANLYVTGIDQSKEFIAYAMHRNPFPDHTSFHVGDARDLPFAYSTFVASLSLLVFNFIPDPEKALREACRVTQPGGGVSAAVWDYGGLMRMLSAFWEAAVEVDARAENLDERQMPLCRAGELSQLWKKGGLESVHEEPLDITMTFNSFADYWNPFLLGQGPAGAYLRSIQDERLQVLRETVKRHLPITSETDAFALPARVWAVRGAVPSRR